jgi:predicted nucleic acid-binding protein
VIHLDTSVLVDALTGGGKSAGALRRTIEDGERVELSTLALYEWLRGPRRAEELAAQEALFPREAAAAFGTPEATIASELYRAVARPRGREVDLAIAACAIVAGARLWTLNSGDFRDVPQLQLYP